ncbi:hypothetical protein [Paenibacillus sp. ACRRY]|uniref:hypothetical protein n=1 Tax=Paenibacillus sp. ACRRY TaxID=2918208 RepID=UPI001EF71779|nr:hypothetical protein [Paenibacillus sp. ACRRY]MCG7383374.1 hypothetical protein [Paenibacillus sp. ACRRY]
MAKLNGVLTVSEDVIEYGGARYEKETDFYPQPKEGDIVRNVENYTFLPEGAYYVLNGSGRLCDEDGDYHDYDSDENVLFRKVVASSDTLAAKRTQLATLTSEIAQLEAQLAEESRLTVGDYARVTDITSVDDFDEGDIVKIMRIKNDTNYPLCGDSVLGDKGEWFAVASLTKITPTEARALLIAKIDAHFGRQEAE